VRVRLLDRAGQVLTEEGPQGISLRTLAADVGTSTSAVYSLFAGKRGLVAALYKEAFQRFANELRRVPLTDDPAEDLVQLGLAYRQNARKNPHLYSIMFGTPMPGFEPDAGARAIALGAFEILQDAAQRCVDQSIIAGPVRELSLAAWGLAHGLVSLELTGALAADPDPTSLYETVLRNTVAGWQRSRRQ
jgi:AcrR family transcriptional regulator